MNIAIDTTSFGYDEVKNKNLVNSTSIFTADLLDAFVQLGQSDKFVTVKKSPLALIFPRSNLDIPGQELWPVGVLIKVSRLFKKTSEIVVRNKTAKLCVLNESIHEAGTSGSFLASREQPVFSSKDKRADCILCKIVVRRHFCTVHEFLKSVPSF